MRKRSTEKSEEQYVSQQKSSFDKKETLVKILHCKLDICSLYTTKGQTISKENYDIINCFKKRTKLTIQSKEDPQESEFRSFFGRIEDTINCFCDLMTFINSAPSK